MPNEQRIRLKLIVAYNGTPFCGWQSQKGGNTIQDWLETAFTKVTGQTLRVHGAGRTDTGVHALAQCAHVDVPGSRLTAERWRSALNASLPQEIRVMRCVLAPATFHARFSARGKIYRYQIFNGPVMPPFEVERAWHVARPLELEKMRAAISLFQGKHDFAAFAANRGMAVDSTVRTISSVQARRRNDMIALEFEGDGFLYKMVRLMVGAVVGCAAGKEDPATVEEQLTHPSPQSFRRLVAPACGLTLVRICY